MTYKGHVRNGMVVLDDAAELPEGAEVEVLFLGAGEVEPETFYDSIKHLIGACKDLPSDFALNHDHYIHGTEKREE